MENLRRQINKKQVLIWMVSLLPVLLAAVFYHKLPARIPTSWGLGNTVAYGDKRTIWLIAGMSPLFGALFFVLPAIDPKRRNYEGFIGAYQGFQIIMQVFLTLVTGIVVVESLRPGSIRVSTAAAAMCGLLFMLLGGMMPRFRQNFFCGFKTPWTLSSEEVWDKTNRMGGKMLSVAGALGFGGAFLPDERWKMYLLFVPLMAAALVPGVMSYVWFRRQEGDL